MTEYENAKHSVLEYLKDRKEYLKIYSEIKNNLETFSQVIKPYKYIPNENVVDFIQHLEKILDEHAELFEGKKE